MYCIVLQSVMSMERPLRVKIGVPTARRMMLRLIYNKRQYSNRRPLKVYCICTLFTDVMKRPLRVKLGVLTA